MKSPLRGSTANDQELGRFYLAIRRWIGWLGIFLPVSLFLFGVLARDFRPSISEFYYTHARDLFIGTLFAIGIFFLSYRGYARKPGEFWSDRIVSKLAGVSIMGVALIPASGEPVPWIHAYFPKWAPGGAVHYASAGVFFACLVVFCLALFRRGRPDMEEDRAKLARNKAYAICGLVILGSMIAMGLIALYRGVTKQPLWADVPVIFGLEAIGVLFFGFSWLLKGEDLVIGKAMRSVAEKLA